MSGLGSIQRRVWRAFIAQPGALLTTGDLVRWCYPRPNGRTLNKHRFVIRRVSTAMQVYAGFPTQAPAADGLTHPFAGDHNFRSK